MTAGRIAEAFIADLARINTPGQISEAFASALVTGPSLGGELSKAFITALAYVGDCATARCDLWKITRKDGVVLAFTSLDEDFVYGGLTYRHCASLSDTASESSTEIGGVGSVELTGILDDDAITPADLYAGLYDDAFVEVWVVNWGSSPDPATPFRIAAGWIGKVSHGEISWTAEVTGPGAKLQQTALIEFFAPGCRWTFGVNDGLRSFCPVNVEALAVRGINVTGALQRYTVFFDAPAPSEAALWNGGRVRWTYGKNAGVECQVDTVDFTAQALSLWDLAPFPPEAGDSFDLLPGCPKDKASCKFYGAYVSFGGFSDVPGPDALQQNADSLFTGSNG